MPQASSKLAGSFGRPALDAAPTPRCAPSRPHLPAGVDPEEDIHTVPGPLGDLGRRDPGQQVDTARGKGLQREATRISESGSRQIQRQALRKLTLVRHGRVPELAEAKEATTYKSHEQHRPSAAGAQPPMQSRVGAAGSSRHGRRLVRRDVLCMREWGCARGPAELARPRLEGRWKTHGSGGRDDLTC